MHACYIASTADIYAYVADTPLGKATPEENREKARKGIDVVRDLAKARS
jgi:hypothetical protein